jgi:hypothetical protein
MEEEEKIQEGQGEQKLRGRAAALAAYKAAYPDLQEDPDDDVLHDFHGDRFSELEGKYADIEGRYNKLNEPNIQLAKHAARDPRLAAAISEMAGENPKSFPYVIGNIYGKEGFGLEGEDLEEFEKGYQEKLKHEEELTGKQVENLKNYESALSQYAKDKGLKGEQEEEIHRGIVQMAEDLNMGVVSADLIDLVYKGLNYEKDVREAFVVGKNDTIDAKLKKPEDNFIPDLGNTSGAGKNIPRSPKGGLGFPDEY